MREIFDRYRKAIITGGGVAVFILAGMITMFLTENESPNVKPSPQKSSVQTQNKTSSPQLMTQESRQPSRTIYAYITGGVKNPGVYKLSDDARLFQLVDMAGGFSSKADTESLNLAEFVADGVHVHIGENVHDGQPPLIPGMPAGRVNNNVTARTAQQPTLGRVNINTANASELESLPGIGPVIAQRIIDYRNAHGDFARPENLINVRGISQSALANLLPYVTAPSTGTTSASYGRININTATASELESLPGIGPVIAQRIIDYRNTHGDFARPENLINVRGISQSALANILPHVTASSTGTTSASYGRVNINTATASELESLPGIGPVIAQRIIDYRNAHGDFAQPENLINVRGISQSALANLLPYVTASSTGMRVAQSYVTASSTGTMPTSSGRININTATASELESLSGIGPAIAQRIIDYRNAHGNFSRPDDIINVRGIGQARLAQILPHITASATGTRIIQPQSSAGKIDINRANSQELQRLKGVGKVTAQRIIEYRQSHGRFNSPDDLVNIRGISRAKLDGMRDQIIIR